MVAEPPAKPGLEVIRAHRMRRRAALETVQSLCGWQTHTLEIRYSPELGPSGVREALERAVRGKQNAPIVQGGGGGGIDDRTGSEGGSPRTSGDGGVPLSFAEIDVTASDADDEAMSVIAQSPWFEGLAVLRAGLNGLSSRFLATDGLVGALKHLRVLEIPHCTTTIDADVPWTLPPFLARLVVSGTPLGIEEDPSTVRAAPQARIEVAFSRDGSFSCAPPAARRRGDAFRGLRRRWPADPEAQVRAARRGGRSARACEHGFGAIFGALACDGGGEAPSAAAARPEGGGTAISFLVRPAVASIVTHLRSVATSGRGFVLIAQDCSLDVESATALCLAMCLAADGGAAPGESASVRCGAPCGLSVSRNTSLGAPWVAAVLGAAALDVMAAQWCSRGAPPEAERVVMQGAKRISAARQSAVTLLCAANRAAGAPFGPCHPSVVASAIVHGARSRAGREAREVARRLCRDVKEFECEQ